MPVVLKPKRSESSGAPASGDLEAGELAVNLADKEIFVKNSSGAIVTIANFATADPSLTFPTGDLGDLSAQTTDAFGQTIGTTFDSLDTPPGTSSSQDLGALS